MLVMESNDTIAMPKEIKPRRTKAPPPGKAPMSIGKMVMTISSTHAASIVPISISSAGDDQVVARMMPMKPSATKEREDHDDRAFNGARCQCGLSRR